MNSNDNAEMPQTDSRLTQFLALETQVWEALTKGDAKADAALLTPDFLGVYPSGFAGRTDHTGQLDAGPVMQSYQLDQVRLNSIAPDSVLLSYRASYQRVGGDHEVMFISSLWQRRDGRWLNSFSQDTPAAS